MKYLKHYYGSITVRENILYLCMYVSNTTKTTKGLNDKVSEVNYVFLNVRFFLWFDAVAVFEAGKGLIDKVYWGKECLHGLYILRRLTAVGEYERVIVFSLEVTLERVC